MIMALEKLNMLADEHRVAQTDETFRTLYMELSEARSIHNSLVTRSGYGDESDAIEIFDESLLRILRKNGEFGRLFHFDLKCSRNNFFKRKKRERLRQSSLEVMTEYGAETPVQLHSEFSTEDIALRKKEVDQRKLIDSLVNDPDQVDHVTTEIVTQFSQYPSITALGKALGLHHEVVKRKLIALSRRYDANRFGDYHDYLAV